MKYLIEKSNKSIKQRICDINNVDIDKLNVDDFKVDDIEIVNEFKEKLLSYSDKRFFIVGDYDCDGICATTIMKKLFDDLNIKSNYYIPSRSKEGYGLNTKIVDIVKDNGFDILVTVDNGVACIEEIKYANKLGIKVFVIDHHEYSEAPVCEGFLHPNLFDEKYSDMCAGGLCCLLSNSIREDIYTTVLGGLATLGDMVSVFNYNRYLLKKMISLLNTNDIVPIKLLLGKNEISYQSLQFNVIPKINAVSRLDEFMNVNLVVRYLLLNTDNVYDYYSKIELINSKRKELTKVETSLAESMIANEDFIIVSSNDFKEGLCGLIANKLMYQYNKPVLVLSENNGVLKGSGRGPSGFNLYDYLNDISSIFDNYGGHAQAVGLTIQKDKLNELWDYINLHPFEIIEDNKAAISINQSEVDFNLLKEIDELAPYGTGFVEPLFVIEDPVISKTFMVQGKYPKFTLGNNFDSISFNPDHKSRSFSKMIGKIAKDNYHKNNISMTIEELI